MSGLTKILQLEFSLPRLSYSTVPMPCRDQSIHCINFSKLSIPFAQARARKPEHNIIPNPFIQIALRVVASRQFHETMLFCLGVLFYLQDWWGKCLQKNQLMLEANQKLYQKENTFILLVLLEMSASKTISRTIENLHFFVDETHFLKHSKFEKTLKRLGRSSSEAVTFEKHNSQKKQFKTKILLL